MRTKSSTPHWKTSRRYPESRLRDNTGMQRLVRMLAPLACAFVFYTAGAMAQTPPKTVKKADASKPVFNYIAGPTNCTQPAGYPDAALCQVPDEKPPGTFKAPGPGG